MSKNPSVFTILFEDTAALVGLIFAFCGILAAQLFNMLGLDGAASIAIAAVLASTAVFLDRDSKSLLLGETDALDLEKAISIIVEADPAIQRANGILTVHLAPKQVIAGLRIEF